MEAIESMKIVGFLFFLMLALPQGWADSRILPPPQGMYHSAFPDFGGSEDVVTVDRIHKFEALTRKPIVWAYFSNNWFHGIHFPLHAVLVINGQHKIPFIRMMPRSTWNENRQDPIYSMQRVLRGDFDADLRQWAIDAKNTAIPLMVEFGTEVNGQWFPWNGKWNGGGATTGYGNPNVPDGPERFRDAYRHIIRLFRNAGAANITWVFHVDAQPDPDVPWNRMAAYYPGDSYIDWIGVSVYGAQTTDEDWQSFTEVFDPAYPKLSALSTQKPLAVLEFGVTGGHPSGNKAAWIHDAFQAFKSNRYPRVRAISYWHERWINDDGSVSNLRIDSSPEALKAYQTEVASPLFIGSH